MGEVISIENILEPVDQNGIRESDNHLLMEEKKSVNKPLLRGSASAPLLGGGVSGSLFIGSGNFPGNQLSATGVFLSGGTFQGPSPFKNTVPQKFQNNIEQQTFTHVISTESEKNSLVSNLAQVSGHYGNVEGSASLNFASEIHITQTSLNVFKYASLSLGSMVFDFTNQELSDNVVQILDPTLEHNKDPDVYLSNIQSFLSTYGYYYISSYQLYGEILASWQIMTSSKKDKQEIGAELSGKVTGGAFDFSGVNKFVSEVSSSFSQSSTTFSSIGIGVNKNIQTIDQLNNVFNDFLSSINQNTAKISKIFISPWASLSQIAVYISKINNTQLREKVIALLNGPKLTQEIWNRILMLRSGILSMRDRMQSTLDDPYNFDFWGFLTSYETLPLDKIQNMIRQLNMLLDKLNSLDVKDFAASFFEFQKTEIPIWDKIQKDYIDITRAPTYSFFIKTGYFAGTVTGPISGYDLVQGETANGVFDTSTTQVNSPIYTGPSLMRPYFFATAWQQGVMSFIKTPQSNKRNNPFSIELECRLAWTTHLDWDPKKETVKFIPNQTKTLGAAIYDTTLNSIPLRGIIGVELTERR